MKKKALTFLLVILILICMRGQSSASLTTIGTATYWGIEYKLIWDANNNGNSVVWLDFTDYTRLDEAKALIAMFDLGYPHSSLIYNVYPAYTIDWGSSAWRLPVRGEMDHLFFDELMLSRGPYIQSEILNASDFDYLVPALYWSSTVPAGYFNYVWCFWMAYGYEQAAVYTEEHHWMAVRNGEVTVALLCSADLDNDQVVDGADLGKLVQLLSDGNISINELGTFAAAFGSVVNNMT